jgi:hypothetical protein
MVSGTSLLASNPVRAMLVGYPGAGKTGALACLLNAGFKLRILDFDGNLEPLLLYADKSRLGNLDVMSFEDKVRMGQGGLEPIGIPTAFANAFKAMDKWDNGEESANWGLETVVVLDSLTAMGSAAMARSMKLNNKTPMNMTDRVWGMAMAEQEEFVKRLTSSANRHHVIVLAHLKMIGPKDVRKGDSPLTTQIKEEVGSLIDTRLYPSALGWQLPQNIGQHFPTLLEVSAQVKVGTVKRVLKLQPRAELDVKLPSTLTEKELDIKDGMLQIFRTLSPASVALVTKQGEVND